MTIIIANMRKGRKNVDFVCDRTSPLGNPFYMGNESERDYVCDSFDRYFQKNLNPDIAPVGFLEYLDEILQATKKGDVTLGCWCAPLRCHCTTIKNYVETQI